MYFDCQKILNVEPPSFLRELVEAAVKSLKMGWLTGVDRVDSIAANLVKTGDDIIEILTFSLQKHFKNRRMTN